MERREKMSLEEKKRIFEENCKIYEQSTLTFEGVEGYDVYNTCIPFWSNGKQYMFGRVEKRDEWARSWVRLFMNTGKDRWTLVPDAPWYQLEDPYISIIDGTLVLGGTHVKYDRSKIETYYGYFYQGKDLFDLRYYTTGPVYMKDIRLVSLADGRVGVFSRPRDEKIMEKYKCESMIGFTIIENIDELSPEVIAKAPYIEGIFSEGEWGGCNQCYLLDSGLIGVIGHKCYKEEENSIYLNSAFIFDPVSRKILEEKIIGTRCCYPEGPAKIPTLKDCAFTSGIVMREDGRADLYSGIGDCQEGRIVIDDPFKGYGRICTPVSL